MDFCGFFWHIFILGLAPVCVEFLEHNEDGLSGAWVGNSFTPGIRRARVVENHLLRHDLHLGHRHGMPLPILSLAAHRIDGLGSFFVIVFVAFVNCLGLGLGWVFAENTQKNPGLHSVLLQTSVRSDILVLAPPPVFYILRHRDTNSMNSLLLKTELNGGGRVVKTSHQGSHCQLLLLWGKCRFASC